MEKAFTRAPVAARRLFSKIDQSPVERQRRARACGVQEAGGRSRLAGVGVRHLDEGTEGRREGLGKDRGLPQGRDRRGKEGGLFKEFGATRQRGPMTAYEELQAKAREFHKLNPHLAPD